MEIFQIIVKIIFLICASLSAVMWWRSANVPQGTSYDCGDLDKPDDYVEYYNGLKWWEKQFFPIRYPTNKFHSNDISMEYNRYAATYACIATVFAILDALI